MCCQSTASKIVLRKQEIFRWTFLKTHCLQVLLAARVYRNHDYKEVARFYNLFNDTTERLEIGR